MAIKQETDHGVSVPESYAKLFDTKVTYLDELKKLKKRFDTDASSLVKTYDETTVKLAESDANLSGEFKAKVADEKKRREAELAQLKGELAQLSEALEGAIKAVESSRKEAELGNQKARQAAQKEHEKALKALETAKSALTKAHAEKKNEIQTAYDTHMQQIEDAGVALKNKLDADLAAFDNALAASLKELEAATSKTVADLQSSIEKDTNNYEKAKSALLATHTQELAAIDAKAKETNSAFEQQLALIKEAYEKAFDQQKNFLSKCEKEADVAGRNIHLAEIKKLQSTNNANTKNVERQLKAALAVIANEKLEKQQDQARQLSKLLEEFLLGKVKNENSIEVEKATLESETNRLKTEKEQKVNARFRVYQEALNTSAKERALTLETKEVESLEQDHVYAVQLENYENDKKVAALKHEQGLIAFTEKDELIKLQKDAEIEKLKLDFALAEEKVHHKELLTSNALAYQLQQFEYDEVLAFYKNDYARQQAISKDINDYRGILVEVEKGKVQQLSVFDEFEIRQRYEEKISVFKNSLELLDAQAALLAKKVNAVFANEEALYQEKIAAIIKPLKASMAKYKKEADAEIEAKQKERDQLLADGKEKETNDMVKKINAMVSQKEKNLRQMEVEMKEKTKIYNDALAGLAARKDFASKETLAFVAKQKAQLEKSIQLLNDEMATELKNRDTYVQGNTDHANALTSFTTSLLATADGQHQSYLARRSEGTNGLIAKLKADFDAENAKQEAILAGKVAKSEQQDSINKKNLELSNLAVNKKRTVETAKVESQIASTNAQFAAWKKQQEQQHNQQLATTKQKTIQKVKLLTSEGAQLMAENSKKDADLVKQLSVLSLKAARGKVALAKKLEVGTKQTKRNVAVQLNDNLRQLHL